jgi:hypothetical protein
MQNRATELNAGIRRTIEQLANETDAARQSQIFRDYLRTSAAFWDYSWHNQMLAPMFFRDKRRTEDGSQDEIQRIWFKVVYVFDRLSRDLRPSLCALDGSRQCHFGKSSR